MKRKLMYFLLSALGFSAACDKHENEPGQVCMYGTPRIDFRIRGKVSDPAGNPIPGIEVRGGQGSYSDVEPAFTDKEGLYDIAGSAFPAAFDLSFNDIDGPENGGEFEPKTLSVRFADDEQTQPGEGGWFQGTYARTGADVTLAEKSVAEEE